MKVLARYDPESASAQRMREALARAPDEVKLAHRGRLEMAIMQASVRYTDALIHHDILAAEVEDTILFLLRRELKETELT